MSDTPRTPDNAGTANRWEDPRDISGGATDCDDVPLEPGEHELGRRVDWEGDPDVINGTRSWETVYCKACGAEGEELDRPCFR